MEGGAHLCPLSVGLDHEDDTRVGLVQRVSVQQSLARHAQLHFGDAGCRTAEAGSGRGGLLDLVHSGPSWEWERAPIGRNLREGRGDWRLLGGRILARTRLTLAGLDLEQMSEREQEVPVDSRMRAGVSLQLVKSYSRL